MADALDLGSSGQPCGFKSHLAQIISKTGESRFSFWGAFLTSDHLWITGEGMEMVAYIE